LTIPSGASTVDFDLVGVTPVDFTDLNSPNDVVVNGTNGDLLIADLSNSRIRRVTASTGGIGTIAGTTAGFAGDGGPAHLAMLNQPASIAYDSAGNVFIADRQNHRIRRVDASTGVITTVAGNATFSCGQVRDGHAATDAGLCNPRGLFFDPGSGALYF